jgi:hypothetical protein
MAFLLTWLVGTAAALLAGFVPLRLASVVLGSTIVVGSAWWYVRSTSAHIRTLPQPAAYAIGLGALLAVCIRLTALVARVAGDGALRHHLPGVEAWWLATVASAVMLAIVLGGLGGLIAALQIPGAARASRVSLIVIGVVVFVVLVAGAGVVLFIGALAKAMSDAG